MTDDCVDITQQRIRDTRFTLLTAQQQFEDGLKAVQKALDTLEIGADAGLVESPVTVRQKDGRRTRSKIAMYPDLERFIRQHIDRHTYDQLVCLIKQNFPREMHTSASAISRWWLEQTD